MFMGTCWPSTAAGWAGELMPLTIPTKNGRRWDLVALGEVMLRFDPGEARIHTTREFRVCEGGGEYNVARGLKRCFGLDTALVSAFADNPVGRLVQDLIFQGGVDQSHVKWVKYDGVGRAARNGLNFVERGFGVRAGVGCSDRGHTAVAQLAPGDLDWTAIFDREGVRWFHTGGIFCALSVTPKPRQSTTGRRSAGPTARSSTPRPVRISRSWIGSAAAIRSRPASSTGWSAGAVRNGRSNAARPTARSR